MSRDIALLLIGASIALVSSLVTALAQHLLSLRAERIKRVLEKEARESEEFRNKLAEGSQAHLSMVENKFIEREAKRGGIFFRHGGVRADMAAACRLTGKPKSRCDCEQCKNFREQYTD